MDDVVDIAIQTVMGAAQTGTIVEPLAAGDAVNRNDREFRSSFPYLALPHSDSVNLGTERPPRASDFIAVTPDRVLDTRSSTGQIGYIGSKPAAGQVVEVTVTGTGSSMVPDDATSVVVHVTATEAEAPSYVTVYDCDDPRPTASNVNATADPGSAWSNLATAGISADGTICLYTLAASHLIVDINGYMPSTSTITATTPERLLETRADVRSDRLRRRQAGRRLDDRARRHPGRGEPGRGRREGRVRQRDGGQRRRRRLRHGVELRR